MNPDDIQFNDATLPVNDRPEPALTGTDRLSPTVSATRSDKHTLTTREVMKMFDDAGVPRNQRTIERYCKGGDLDCFPDTLEKRYYITQESADILIGQLKEIAARHQAISVNPAPQQSPTSNDTPPLNATTAASDAGVKQGTPEKRDEKQVGEYERQLIEKEARIKELENEKYHLEIDKLAKEKVIDILREQRTIELKEFTAEITKHSHRVGQLETEMRQLKAPDPDTWPTRSDRRTVDDGAAMEAEFNEATTPRDDEQTRVSTNEPQP